MALKLYNSLTRRVEIFRPLSRGRAVGLYTCGPTVYNFAHIGNLRTYIFEDVLERVLKWNGYSVKRVMNITDVGHLTGDSDIGGDKVEEEAKREKKSVKEIAGFYTKAFLRDLKELRVRIPRTLAPATRYVPDQIEVIKRLVKKDVAYDTPTAVYFNVRKYGAKRYLKLSRQPLGQKLIGAREAVVADPHKRSPADFVLWFKLVGKFKHHILRWPSPWGVGFPGWHIECSAISRKFLGQPFDIHTGGVDHVGTHHTNEIAQSEGAFGKPLARFWLHGEFLLIDEKRMGKSEGNFFTLTDIKKRGFHPLAFRYLVLQSHYQSKLNFTWKSLEAAQKGLEGLYKEVFKLTLEKRGEGKEVRNLLRPFTEAINKNLDAPRALSFLRRVVENTEHAPEDKLETLKTMDKILGLGFEKPKTAPKASPRIFTLLEKREAYRKSKQFIQSDRLRKQIDSLGYTIEDTAEGPIVWPKKIL
ncbi:cysteine--tRNA ligase [Candidatus Parcubacteria bacterium]|nr:MAG: cysteine--tRNA ligase [Candidatus Parcubacteria bacterium]